MLSGINNFRLKGINMRKFFLLLSFVVLLLNGCGKKEQTVEQPLKPEPQSSAVQQSDVPSGETGRGTQATVTVSGGQTNSPPMLKSIEVTPRFPKKGDAIKVEINAVDPEGDKIGFTYQWKRNGQSIPETGNTLHLNEEFKRGDKIHMIVTPYDDHGKGTPGFMDVTIENSPPQIISSPAMTVLKDRQFTYQAKAVDPENDTVSYTLKNSPAGMTINKDTGLVQWSVPQSFKGNAAISIIVTDGQGGESQQNFVIEITAEATK